MLFDLLSESTINPIGNREIAEISQRIRSVALVLIYYVDPLICLRMTLLSLSFFCLTFRGTKYASFSFLKYEFGVNFYMKK